MGSCILFVLFLLAALPAFAAETAPATETTFVARAGERMQKPVNTTYRQLEISQQRGSWIYPDVGYYDSGHTSDQLWFLGAGREFIVNKHVDWTQIVYVEQEVGRDARNQRAIWIWPVLNLQFTPRLSSETVLYPTIPINRSQRWEFDLDRSKMEYALNPLLRVGAGYSATVGAECAWQNRPF